ncbi:MAG: branched-chain amino acid ABC transporter permease [Dehalococcoidia bacterium]|nr:branched-chain amino acid ABC transporter permease [Dehalococcoidia bacterium]
MLPCGTFNEDYGRDTAVIRTRLQWLLTILALAVLLTLPLYSSYYLIGLVNKMAIWVIAIMGLQLMMGYCGLISFGQVAFVAIGAYTSAILTASFGWPFWAALPMAGIVAGLAGIIGGAPALRIKGFYLALATLAIHYIVAWLILHLHMTGGAMGMHVPAPTIGAFAFDTDQTMFYIIIPMMLLMTYFAKNLARSRVGRAFVAIRDNDLAAAVMGVNLFYYKLLAFFIGCFFAGIAGSLFASWYTFVHVEMFSLNDAVFYIGILIVGGLGTITGVFFGTALILGLVELVIMASPTLTAALPGLGMAPAAALGATAFGIIIVLFLIFEPRGLAHRWQIFRASYRLFPFAY